MLRSKYTMIRDTPSTYQTLQRLQNRAARIVLRRDSSKDTLNVLGWVELETKRKRHKCALVYKCLNNLVPNT